ncbi:hypothetical protein [Burkholderia perseverans]|uniref:hypothetical protein n=1 Tax=Burkholderia perseverans TaxID=2615214 RepID=UPI001FEFB571|nr:hypothetical protein [Burkholderia perseverans]
MNPPAPTSWLDHASAASASHPGLFAYLGVDWTRIVLALLLCIALGVAAAFVLRARTARGAPREAGAAPRIRVVEHARLPSRTTLHLVEYDQRVVLLMSDASGTRVVDAHDRSLPEA